MSFNLKPAEAHDIDVASMGPIQSFWCLNIITSSSNLYKGFRSVVLAPSVQRQCPVVQVPVTICILYAMLLSNYK